MDFTPEENSLYLKYLRLSDYLDSDDFVTIDSETHPASPNPKQSMALIGLDLDSPFLDTSLSNQSKFNIIDKINSQEEKIKPSKSTLKRILKRSFSIVSLKRWKNDSETIV